MLCGEVRHYISARLEIPSDGAVRRHLDSCELCARFYADAHLATQLAALKDTPLPDPEFARKAVATAIKVNEEAAKPRLRAVSAIAASLVLGVATLLSVQLLRGDATPSQQVAQQTQPGEAVEVTGSFDQEKAVNVVIYASHPQDDAVVAVELWGDVELEGYPGEVELVWNTKLKQGANLLTLPVKMVGDDGGSVSVTSVYGGNSRRVDVVVKPPKDNEHQQPAQGSLMQPEPSHSEYPNVKTHG